VAESLNEARLSPERRNTVSYNTSPLMLFGLVAGADCENYTGNIFCGKHVEMLSDISRWYVEVTQSYVLILNYVKYVT